jgi:gluconokinase
MRATVAIMQSMVVVVMGVAGAGKSTVGKALAQALGWRFVDGDDLHPSANRDKLARGLPLDDVDRAPWLARLAKEIRDSLRAGQDLVLAASALKERYRRQLSVDPSQVRFVFLTAPPALLAERLRRRTGHFMAPGLLPSQLADLEPPEGVLTVDVTPPPDQLVSAIRRGLGL